MSLLRPIGMAGFLLFGLVRISFAAPPDLALPKGSGEAGFRRFMEQAHAGHLGSDVTDANVGVLKNYVRIELVRAGAPTKVLFLQPKTSTRTISRYFDIEAGDEATDRDVVLVGKVLDEVFDEDPFQLAESFFYALPGGEPIPRLGEAWAADGLRGVLRGLARRMSALVGLAYTVAIIAGVALALLTSLLLLWGPAMRDS